MSREEILVAAGGAAALVLAVLVVLALVQVARLRSQVADLRADLERRTTTAGADVPPASEATYVITGFPEGADGAGGARADVVGRVAEPVAAPIDGRLFADIVARETVVKAGGLLHGLRRALDPETRNRIRFEMRREVKRSRKQRRADLKAAMRDFRARERAAAPAGDPGAAAPHGDEEDAA